MKNSLAHRMAALFAAFLIVAPQAEAYAFAHVAHKPFISPAVTLDALSARHPDFADKQLSRTPL